MNRGTATKPQVVTYSRGLAPFSALIKFVQTIQHKVNDSHPEPSKYERDLKWVGVGEVAASSCFLRLDFFPFPFPFLFLFYCFLFLGGGQPRPFFPFWCFVGVRLFKLRLRQPRELGDRAFLEAVLPPKESMKESAGRL